MIDATQLTNRIVRRVQQGTIGVIGALLTAMIAVFFPVAAQADDRLGDTGDQAQALRSRSQGSVKPLDSVIDTARSKGKVLDVELKGSKYRVKVLDTDGRVRNVDVDASSGSRGGSSDNDNRSHGGRGSDESSSGRGRGRGR